MTRQIMLIAGLQLAMVCGAHAQHPASASNMAPRRAGTICRGGRLPAARCTSRAGAGSPISATTAPASSDAHQPAQRQEGRQRHLDPRRHRPAKSEVDRPYSRRAGAGAKAAARRWCACATASSLPSATQRRSTCCASSATRARDLGRHQSGEARRAHRRRAAARHAQELVGMRHRHRLSRLGPAGLAHAAA